MVATGALSLSLKYETPFISQFFLFCCRGFSCWIIRVGSARGEDLRDEGDQSIAGSLSRMANSRPRKER
tara:strand:+ start:315 stop:521 length:207 start_codon:yes stop_codon:yes gene_type:complete